MHEHCGVLEHITDEGDHVEAGESLGVSLVVLDQPPATCGPGEGSVHRPAYGQQDKVAFGLRQLDDMHF